MYTCRPPGSAVPGEGLPVPQCPIRGDLGSWEPRLPLPTAPALRLLRLLRHVHRGDATAGKATTGHTVCIVLGAQGTLCAGHTKHMGHMLIQVLRGWTGWSFRGSFICFSFYPPGPATNNPSCLFIIQEGLADNNNCVIFRIPRRKGMCAENDAITGSCRPP